MWSNLTTPSEPLLTVGLHIKLVVFGFSSNNSLHNLLISDEESSILVGMIGMPAFSRSFKYILLTFHFIIS